MAVARGGETLAVRDVDVLVVGSGGAAFVAALTARHRGLEVLLVEKDAQLGGTTAFSGAVLWIPANPKIGGEAADSLADARAYLQAQAGNYFNPERVDAFLRHGPEMVTFLERETEVDFFAFPYPDYHPEQPGASTMRSIGTYDYDYAKLGEHRELLRSGLTQTNFLGLAVGSNVEMKQLMSAGRSLAGLGFVTRKMLTVLGQVLRYGRPQPVTRGRALIARLLRSAIDMGVDIWTSAPARELIMDGGRVTGAVVQTRHGPCRVMARRGVVLAAGGFPHDPERQRRIFSHVAAGGEHHSVAPPGNTGDGARMAEAVGGSVDYHVQQPAAFMPVSVIPYFEGTKALWPHIVDRQKPGFLCVTRDGRRFFDESAPYHDFVPAMVKACAAQGQRDVCCYMIADLRAMRRYGMGFAKPAPVPWRHHVRSGYLIEGATLADVARQAGIDGPALEATVARFNQFAQAGEDPDFGRGQNIYDHSQGDPDHKPNPNLAPLEQGPFFALRIVAGDIGTFAGLRTNGLAQVLGPDDAPIPGLYAAGNDALGVASGAYPGAGGTLGPGMTLGYIAALEMAGQTG